ncbi:Protein CBG12001 [Caenorhabditis briggsae]|uniref:Protein CBG12001 n=3 Tax=Caenorhabditis briggsae TaxID=6238 RepID=A8XEB4_CAEBR|nr:Protein CBG12001 [Caenorhabditis briggsae]ULU11726.1 hypothetical protein L3Y34_015258 [Caenorhabditis briggsae]CAP31049.2 Protein CBG12001 [Caenorhabditis briggsae]
MGRHSPRDRKQRDRSPERRRRSRSRSNDRLWRRDRKRDESPRDGKEIKEEVFSDSESSRHRQDNWRERKNQDRRNDRRDDRRDFDSHRDHRTRNDREERNRDDRRNQREDFRKPDQVRNDGKRYGLEQKEIKREEPWGKSDEAVDPFKEKEKVNMGTSGALTEDTNTFRGVVIKYNEPPEAKKPNARWRLYPFKGDEALQVLYVHRQSAYLIGRDHKIADIPVDHPSCSKQHAVLQFRSMPFTRDDGTKARRIMPYIIDLGSGNGTFLNEQKIEPQRYIELKEKDMLKFGFSTREYVVMKEREITEEELAGGVETKHEDSD